MDSKSSKNKPEFGPLNGLKVLDLGMLIAGPFGASLLADFGADVIKIEQPKTGDPSRQAGKGTKDGRSMVWINVGRNKRSITLDLRKREGQEIFKKLAEWADVIIENFKPKTLESWNIGYDTLSKINPKLIMVRVSGYGQTGPYSHKPGLDRLALGFSGLKYITGYPDQPPVKMGVSIADYLTGAFNALSAIMAVYYRDVVGNGKGQEIDLALYEPSLRIQEDIITSFGEFGEVRERLGNRHPSYAPAEIFKTKDGKWVTIHASLDSKFNSLMKIMGKEELIQEDRFNTMRDRSSTESADEVHEMIQDWIIHLTSKEATSLLEEADIPVGPVNNVRDVFEDKHIASRENIVKLADNALGDVSVPNVVPRFSQSPGQVWRPGSLLGADNDEVYLEILNLDENEYENLKAKDII